MKKIIFIIFMILSHVSFGQQNCDEKGITTDPNNPINPQGEPFLNNGDFNWLTPGLWDYYRSDWEQVLNPFDDSGNPNIDYIPARTMPVMHKKIVAGAGSPGPCLLLSDYIVVIYCKQM
jgi:hypothetical protein